MQFTAHLLIAKGYRRAIEASQWIDELLVKCEEINAEHFGDDYLSQGKYNAVVTVTFEVPDSVFERPPIPVIEANIVPPNESTPT